MKRNQRSGMKMSPIALGVLGNNLRFGAGIYLIDIACSAIVGIAKAVRFMRKGSYA
jgi:hypothetical protein